MCLMESMWLGLPLWSISGKWSAPEAVQATDDVSSIAMACIARVESTAGELLPLVLLSVLEQVVLFVVLLAFWQLLLVVVP